MGLRGHSFLHKEVNGGAHEDAAAPPAEPLSSTLARSHSPPVGPKRGGSQTNLRTSQSVPAASAAAPALTTQKSGKLNTAEIVFTAPAAQSQGTRGPPHHLHAPPPLEINSNSVHEARFGRRAHTNPSSPSAHPLPPSSGHYTPGNKFTSAHDHIKTLYQVQEHTAKGTFVCVCVRTRARVSVHAHKVCCVVLFMKWRGRGSME